jgi:CPA1 family monovalent cation:H+ antiporter
VVRFFVDAGVGTLVGLLVGWLIVRALRSTRDPLAETLLTLAGPYVAWVAAEALHASAVLACVAGGLYLRQHLSTAVGAASRLQARSVWDLVVFLLNALIFLLLGVEFARLLPTVPGPVLWPVLRAGAVVGLVAIAVRLVWVPVATAAPRGLSAAARRRDPLPGWRPVFLVAWTSMRGIVSLASALALPARGRVGRAVPVPHRDPAGHDGRDPDDARGAGADARAHHPRLPVRARARPPRRGAAGAARGGAARRRGARGPGGARRGPTGATWSGCAACCASGSACSTRAPPAPPGARRLRAAMMAAERRMLVRLRNEGAISDEVLGALEQELDLEAVRLGDGATHDGDRPAARRRGTRAT